MLLALRRWVWAPVWRTPLPDRNRRLPAATMAPPRPEISIRRPDPMIPADLVAQADAITRADRVAQADLGPIILAAPADLGPIILAAPAAPGPTILAAPAAPAVPADQAAHGAAIRSAATSTAPRGEMDPHPGDPARRRGRPGIGRSHRPAGNGGMAPSTTGATTRRPSGIAGSTSGASGSSESGSRCNR